MGPGCRQQDRGASHNSGEVGQSGDDGRAQSTSSATDSGLGDAEKGSGQTLGEAVVTQDQGDGGVQADHSRPASGSDEQPQSLVDSGGEFSDLFD